MGYEVKLGHGLTECVRLGWATNQSSLVGLGWSLAQPSFFSNFFFVLLTQKKDL